MIRCGQLADIPTIMNVARDFYLTTDYAKFAPFDEETVQELAEMLILFNIVVVTTDENDKVVGVIAFMLTPFVFNKHVTSCVEVIWCVEAAHRNMKHGIQMIQYADKLRKLRGAKHFQLARLNTSPEGLDEVFEGLGFTLSEKYFSKVD